MDQSEALRKVENARHPRDLFTPGTLHDEFLSYARLLHPDVGGPEAIFQKLTHLRDTGKKLLASGGWDREVFTRSSYVDDGGPVYRRGQVLFHVAPDDARKKVLAQAAWIQTQTDDRTKNFARYLPNIKAAVIEAEGRSRDVLAAHMPVGAVRLGSSLFHENFPNGLPTEHVGWILSRLFEFCWWMHSIGKAHIGLTPLSVHIVPKTHGIIVGPMYHLTDIGKPCATGTAAFKQWYPARLLMGDHTSAPDIDLYMAKRLACWLQGDPSGTGTSLYKNKALPKKWVEYLVASPPPQPKTAYDAHRSALKAVFGPPKFHELELKKRK